MRLFSARGKDLLQVSCWFSILFRGFAIGRFSARARAGEPSPMRIGTHRQAKLFFGVIRIIRARAPLGAFFGRHGL